MIKITFWKFETGLDEVLRYDGQGEVIRDVKKDALGFLDSAEYEVELVQVDPEKAEK